MQSFKIETKPVFGFTLCITRACGCVERLFYGTRESAQQDAEQAPDDRKCILCENRDIVARIESRS